MTDAPAREAELFTPEAIALADAVLKAAGSGLRFYSLPSVRTAILAAAQLGLDARTASAEEALGRIVSKVKVLRGSGRLKRAVESNPQTTEEFLATTAVNIERIALKAIADCGVCS